MTNGKKFLWVLLALIFAVSIFYSFHYKIKPSVDAGAYNNIGWNLARGCGYIEVSANCGHPELDNGIGRVGPGYELFLAAVYKLFGHRVWIIWMIHALLRVFTAFIIYKLAIFIFEEYWYKDKIGLTAAALFGFSIDLITLNAMLLIETLFLFLLALSTYVLLKTLENPNYKSVLISSLLIAVTFLTRPTAAFLLIAMSIILVFQKKIIYAFLLFLFPIMLVAPWAVRSWNIYHHLILSSSTGGYDLWVGNNAASTGGFDKTPEITNYRRAYGIVQSDKRGWSEYFSFIKSEPLKFIDLQYNKTAIYFSLLRPTGFWDYLGNIGKVFTLGLSFIWTAILFGFGLAGLFLTGEDVINLFRKRVFILFAVLQPLSVIPVIVETRYRAPFFIFIAISGAFVIAKFFYEEAARVKIRKMLYWSYGFLFLFFFWDIAGNVGEVLKRLNKIL